MSAVSAAGGCTRSELHLRCGSDGKNGGGVATGIFRWSTTSTNDADLGRTGRIYAKTPPPVPFAKALSGPCSAVPRDQPQLPRGCFACDTCGYVGASQLGLSMHVTQVHRRRLRLGRKTRCLEARVYRLLALLAPDIRRKVLLSRTFSQAQRLALERWALANRQAASPEKVNGTSWCSSASHFGECFFPRKRRQQHQTGQAPRKVSHRSCNVVRRVTRCGVAYVVAVAIGPFRLFTRHTSDFSRAIVFRDTLIAIRQRTAASVVAEGGDIGTSFADALVDVPWRFGFDGNVDMGLSFTVKVAAKHWVGRELCSPRFAASRVGDGLRAWRQLREARGFVEGGPGSGYSTLRRDNPAELRRVWQRLKAAYLEVCEEAGQDRQNIASRLAVLESRHKTSRMRLVTRKQRSKEQNATVGSSEANIVVGHFPTDVVAPASRRRHDIGATMGDPRQLRLGADSSIRNASTRTWVSAVAVIRELKVLLQRWSPRDELGPRDSAQ